MEETSVIFEYMKAVIAGVNGISLHINPKLKGNQVIWKSPSNVDKYVLLFIKVPLSIQDENNNKLKYNKVVLINVNHNSTGHHSQTQQSPDKEKGRLVNLEVSPYIARLFMVDMTSTFYAKSVPELPSFINVAKQCTLLLPSILIHQLVRNKLTKLNSTEGNSKKNRDIIITDYISKYKQYIVTALQQTFSEDNLVSIGYEYNISVKNTNITMIVTDIQNILTFYNSTSSPIFNTENIQYTVNQSTDILLDTPFGYI